MNQWSFDFSAELNAFLPKDWTLSVDGCYMSPSLWGMEKLSEWYEMNMAIKKYFPNNGLTLTARINNLFLCSKWSSCSLGMPEGFSNNICGNDRTHRVSLGISYKFGSLSESRTIHANPSNIESNDITNKRHRR